MSRFDAKRVAYHIRRLDADRLAALVADLWSARGYEIAREGDTVLARHGAEAVRIRIESGTGTPSATPPDVVVTTEGDIRVQLVRQYLSTPETRIAGVVERDGRRLYRIEGEGVPNVSSTATIRNYSVEALVDSDGFVHDVTVRATVEHPQNSGQTLRIEREYTYDRVDETTIEPPAWYLNHTETGNGTG